MKLQETDPVVLRIHWAVQGEQDEPISFEATL
jgi:hypothetical protein